MLTKREGDAVIEYPVDPSQIGNTLASNMRFETGILGGNTILIRVDGGKKTIVEYRPPQMTGIYLEKSENPLRVPMPGLLMFRTTGKNTTGYLVFAVKDRPVTGDEPLFAAPLPNMYAHGSICWGTVIRVSEAAMKGTTLDEDWTSLLGSPFNDHGVDQKSKAFPKDIRKQLIAIETRKARTYPVKDLLPANKTLKSVLSGSLS